MVSHWASHFFLDQRLHLGAESLNNGIELYLFSLEVQRDVTIIDQNSSLNPNEVRACLLFDVAELLSQLGIQCAQFALELGVLVGKTGDFGCIELEFLVLVRVLLQHVVVFLVEICIGSLGFLYLNRLLVNQRPRAQQVNSSRLTQSIGKAPLGIFVGVRLGFEGYLKVLDLLNQRSGR